MYLSSRGLPVVWESVKKSSCDFFFLILSKMRFLSGSDDDYCVNAFRISQAIDGARQTRLEAMLIDLRESLVPLSKLKRRYLLPPSFLAPLATASALPTEIAEQILRHVKDAETLLECRLVNRSLCHLASGLLYLQPRISNQFTYQRLLHMLSQCFLPDLPSWAMKRCIDWLPVISFAYRFVDWIYRSASEYQTMHWEGC